MAKRGGGSVGDRGATSLAIKDIVYDSTVVKTATAFLRTLFLNILTPCNF